MINLEDSLDSNMSEELLAGGEYSQATSAEEEFDAVVGYLEEILMDDSFVSLQKDFCEKHCDVFEDTEENKLEYMGIFNDYTDKIEAFIVARLSERMENFSMEKLSNVLMNADEVTGDVFDMLMSFSDFDEFKGLILSHKFMNGMDDSMEGSPGEGGDGMLGVGLSVGVVNQSGQQLQVVSGGGGGEFDGGSPAPKKSAKEDNLSPLSREAKESALSPTNKNN